MTDTRLSKQTVNTRPSRAGRNRQVKEDRVSTDATRLETFRLMNAQAALPDLPAIPGYHVCWLTTGNNKDTIQSRMRIGYEAIKPEEIKGFEHAVGKTGTEQDGLIHVNEMVAFKIELGLYNMYMQEAHHFAPAREEGKLTDAVDNAKETLRKKGSRVSEGDGIEAIRELDSVAVPTFDE